MGRFPFPIPSGWFAVAFSSELEAGEVKPVRYFGKELVLFRTSDGEAHLLDAFCPHLGAHLGHGGVGSCPTRDELRAGSAAAHSCCALLSAQ